ncbi:hypothetical protein AMK25_22385 [Micromonospora sp. TSRI0369]|uniref:hypothetical protein n=1 Tax=Micromonospora sp. TSRI0369 TaxID=1703936 RepID=UPI00093CEF2D|nr:hypothetical protein [Micromonospora sp. TSRI0369]OKJ42076.1 hypothetical protein AMK25_22385 [Micromonospora sp. TSRI0369]
MSVWKRWRIAFPLLALSLLMFVPAVFGTWAWWSENGTAYRVLSIIICLVVAGCVGVSLSVGIKRTEDVPWLRIGLVALGVLTVCGLAALRDSV